MRLQAAESRHGDVLRGRDHTPEKVDVLVQVMVVDRVDELAAEDAVHVLQVHDHSGLGIECAADGDLDDVVVAVVGGARAEDLAVLLVAPVVAAQDVRGGERGAAGDADVRGHQGSIRKLAPDRGADSGEASQTIKRATSAGSSAGPSTPAMRNIRVSTAPGLMALTRMRCSRPSTARASVRPASPDFAATYAAMPGNFSAPKTPDRLDTMTIVPPRPRIRRNASRLHRNAPRRPAPSCASQSSAVMSANGRFISAAAQWIRESSESRRPNADTTACSSETSVPSRRLSETTFHPRARSWETTSEPMPPEPPVTTAVRVTSRLGPGLARSGPAPHRGPAAGARSHARPRGRGRGTGARRHPGLPRRPARRALRSRLPLRPRATRRGGRRRPGSRPSALRRQPCRRARPSAPRRWSPPTAPSLTAGRGA